MVNNVENVRLFMTNIIGMAGALTVIGEVVDVNEEAIHEGDGTILRSYSPYIELRHPLRLIAAQGNLTVAAVFSEEEWIKIPIGMAIEMQVTDQIRDIYVKYEQQVFGGGIIVPEEKKIILN